MKQLARPIDEELASLARLRNDSDFKRVLAYLERSHQDSLRRLEDLSDPMVIKQHQGAAQALRDFFEVADDAKQILERKK